MEYQEYIKSELLVLVPVLYIIGMGLKKSKIKDNRSAVRVGYSAPTRNSELR